MRISMTYDREGARPEAGEVMDKYAAEQKASKQHELFVLSRLDLPSLLAE